MNNLLTPIDLDHESSWNKVLPYAFKLAAALDFEVTIMTVVPEITAGFDARYAIRGEMQGSEELDIDAMLTRARTALEQVGGDYAGDDVAFSVIARYGTVYEEVLDVARQLPADQIIMAAHRPSLAHYLLGANTARVVRHASCSVQVIRE